MQQYSSANTSINTVNAIYKKVNFKSGSSILDFGGGKYDTNARWVLEKDPTLTFDVYDPYNRTPQHNAMVLQKYQNVNPDYIICSNVLNVIREPEAIAEVLRQISMLAGRYTKVYIVIYEGNKRGVGAVSKKDCWQRNEKAECYLPLISRFFNSVERKGNVICCS